MRPRINGCWGNVFQTFVPSSVDSSEDVSEENVFYLKSKSVMGQSLQFSSTFFSLFSKVVKLVRGKRNLLVNCMNCNFRTVLVVGNVRMSPCLRAILKLYPGHFRPNEDILYFNVYNGK